MRKRGKQLVRVLIPAVPWQVPGGMWRPTASAGDRSRPARTQDKRWRKTQPSRPEAAGADMRRAASADMEGKHHRPNHPSF